MPVDMWQHNDKVRRRRFPLLRYLLPGVGKMRRESFMWTKLDALVGMAPDVTKRTSSMIG